MVEEGRRGFHSQEESHLESLVSHNTGIRRMGHTHKRTDISLPHDIGIIEMSPKLQKFNQQPRRGPVFPFRFIVSILDGRGNRQNVGEHIFQSLIFFLFLEIHDEHPVGKHKMIAFVLKLPVGSCEAQSADAISSECSEPSVKYGLKNFGFSLMTNFIERSAIFTPYSVEKSKNEMNVSMRISDVISVGSALGRFLGPT